MDDIKNTDNQEKENNNINFKLGMYLISMSVLFFVLSIMTFQCADNFLDFIKSNILFIIFVVLTIISVVVYFRFKHKLNGTRNLPIKIKDIEDKDYELLSFLSSYILPLVFIDSSNTRSIIVLFIMLFIIGAIMIKTNYYVVNPVLALFGYKLYIIKYTTDNDKKIINVITKDKLIIGDCIETMKLDNKLYFAKRSNR